MTHNLYQSQSYWAVTHLLISGLLWSWVPQTGELIHCLLNLKFFHSRICLHQAATPSTLAPMKSSKWLLLSGTGLESSLGQPISLVMMILVHRGLFAYVFWPRAFTQRSKSESQQHCPLVPRFHLVKIHLGPQNLWQPGCREMRRTKENVPWQT